MAEEAPKQRCEELQCANYFEDSIVVEGVRRTRQRISRDGAAGSTRAVAPAVFEFVRSQVCGGPGYVPEGGTGCASAGCVDTAATRVITSRRPVGAPAGAGWQPVGDGCLVPGAPAAAPAPAGPGVAEVIAAEFARLPLVGATAVVQPGQATLVNVPTVFYTEAGVQTFQVVVVGQGVRVSATPVGYTWVFGDGASLGPTTSAGARYPEADITHAYTAPGRVTARVDVTFAGTFAVAGGPPAPIPGRVTIPGTPVPVLIRQARSELIATPHN